MLISIISAYTSNEDDKKNLERDIFEGMKIGNVSSVKYEVFKWSNNYFLCSAANHEVQ